MPRNESVNSLIIKYHRRMSASEKADLRKPCPISLNETEYTVFRLLALDRGLTFSELVRSTMVAAWGDEIEKFGVAGKGR